MNHSARELANRTFVEDLEECFRETGMGLTNYYLEVTEEAIAQSEELFTLRMRNLRSMGLKLCIDDFGTGYSSMVRLSRWPIEVLKIDRSFIQGVTTDPKTQRMTEGMIEFAQRLELNIIMEGIETEQQLEWIRQRGVDWAQGYFFTKPMTIDELVKWEP